MKKFVFALVVLLHLCYGYELNMTLNGEIIERLEKLTELYKANNGSITLPNMTRTVTQPMRKKAKSCVSVFVRELKKFLDNVTVHVESDLLEELQGNLKALDPLPKIDRTCQMMESKKDLRPFNSYISFLRKLNSSAKR